MTKLFYGALASAVLFATAMSGPASADRYDITIINATAGQVVTPPIVLAHSPKFSLFRVGAPASDELVTLAETGSPMALAERFGGPQMVAGVANVALQDELAPVMPGKSTVITLETTDPLITVAAMLAVTNDAFAAARDIVLPAPGETKRIEAIAYDAGSEANNEMAAFIPGLGGNERATEGAEGFVHVHPGVKGIADLNVVTRDWNNPVIIIRITNVSAPS